MRTLLLLIGTLVFAAPEDLIQISAQHAWPPPGLNCPQRMLVLFEAGPNPEKSKDLFPQHVAFLLPLLKSGKIISIGPMAEGQRAAGIFASSDWNEVQDLLKDEPYTQSGVMKVAEHNVWNACEAAK